jgi:CHAD domain-containing protein
MTAEDAARAVIGECTAQIAENMALVRVSDDPEGPHQLRVGLRRLRTAFRLFRPVLGGAALDPLESEAQWLGREAGRLRDLDVAVEDIVAEEIAAEHPDPGLGPLAAGLERRRRAERAALERTVAGPRAGRFLLDLAELTAARLWLDAEDYGQTARLARPAEALAADALDSAMKKAEKRAKKIARLSIEERHELRKSLKRLRYTVEFLAPLFEGDRVKPFLKKLKALQDLFGALNDAAMAEALFRDTDGPAGGSVDAARAAGVVIGARRERARHAWEDAKATWKTLKEADRFWR